MPRGFHAVAPTMNAPDGTPTNAVFGFLSMLLKFIDMEHPDVLVCAFDAGKPEFRMKAIEKYKANRPPMDPTLRAQFPVIEDILTSLQVPVVKYDGWEGDDDVGSVSWVCEANGDQTLLVSGDKDVYQLVTENTHVVTTKKGMSDVVIYGPDEVYERYGVTPAQFTDFLGLKGDASDNIPGVPGIGDVSAKNLLQKYGSIEGIYENIDYLKAKQRQKLEENKDLAFASREVATIVREIPGEGDLLFADESFPSYGADEARATFLKYGLTVHLSHALKFLGEADTPAVAQILTLPKTLDLEAGLARIEGAIAAGERVGISLVEDAQATLFDDPQTWGFAFSDGCFSVSGDEGKKLVARKPPEG